MWIFSLFDYHFVIFFFFFLNWKIKGFKLHSSKSIKTKEVDTSQIYKHTSVNPVRLSIFSCLLTWTDLWCRIHYCSSGWQNVWFVVFAGLLVGALDTVLDSNARVTPFRILLQVPGSQISWVIASGEWKQQVSLTAGWRCTFSWGSPPLCSPGAAVEEVNKHWDWLVHNLLHSLSVFENKEDAAGFVKGKVKVWTVKCNYKHI